MRATNDSYGARRKFCQWRKPASFLALLVLSIINLAAPATADYVGTEAVRIFVDPADLDEILDGIDNGDEFGLILEATPRDTGSTSGHAAWMTFYLPAGAVVIGASMVLPAADGTFSDILAEDTDASYDGCGKRKCRTWTSDSANVTLGNGFVNRVQQDTGIFYSTDPRTGILPAGVDRDNDGVADPLAPTGIEAGSTAFNDWDFDQTKAFGEATSPWVTKKQGKGNTPLASYDDGTEALVLVGTGSPVAGPQTYYTNDYHPPVARLSDPGCNRFNDGSLAQDLTCEGPWQRIGYAGSKLGDDDVIAAAADQCDDGSPAADCIRNTSVATSAGHLLSGSNPLSASTNALRYVHGKRRLGDLEFSRVNLRITDRDAFVSALTDETVCLEAIPGDTSDTAAKDNNWRYYEPSHQCIDFTSRGALIKRARYVNGVEDAGYVVSDGDVIGYEITFYNLSGTTLTDIMLSDIPVAGTALVNGLIEPRDFPNPGDNPDCAFASYDGNLGGGPPYIPNSASSSGGNGPATWVPIPSMAAGEKVTVFLCGTVSGGLTEFARNEATVTYTLPDLTTETLTSIASSVISSCIRGTVWEDNDGSGGQSPGDSPNPFVAVELWDDSTGMVAGQLDDFDTFVDATTTLSDGSYGFFGIAAGDYLLVELDPPGYTSTGNVQTTTCVIAGNANACNVISVTVTAGSCEIDNDLFDQKGPTAALVHEVTAYSDRGEVVVEWTTASEAGTVGFQLMRWNGSNGRWLPVNQRLIPSFMGAVPGGRYRVVDEGYSPNSSGTAHYLLLEVESTGRERSHGPFEVRLEEAGDRPPMASNWDAIPHGPLRRGATDKAPTAIRDAKPLGSLGTGSGSGRATALKLAVETDALYFVASEQIADLMGLPVAAVHSRISSGRLRLNRGASAVAWLPAPTGLYFYGQGTDSLYTKQNIYRITLGAGDLVPSADGWPIRPPGTGIQTFRETAHFEQQNFAATVVAGDPESDYWYWDFLNAGDPTHGTKTFHLNVEDPESFSSLKAALEVVLSGATATGTPGEHHVVVRVNGVEIGESSWEGLGEHRATFELSQANLVAGSNEVELTGLADSGAPYSIFYVDSFHLAYDRLLLAANDSLRFRSVDSGPVTIWGFSTKELLVFDITDPETPLRVDRLSFDDVGGGARMSFVVAEEDREFIATAFANVAAPAAIWADIPSDLRNERGAEYLVVAPPEFLESAELLADYRESLGLSAMVVSLEDIHDEFNESLASPHAVRQFLAYAWAEWATRPRYVALVGTGNWDYRNHLGLGGNHIPPLMVSTSFGLFASDPAFGDIEGSDLVPEIAIGRIPVTTNEELAAYVDKLTAYESSQPPARILMLADASDDKGDYTESSNAISTLLPGSYEIDPVHLSEMDIGSARSALFQALDEGVAWVNYLGHGGVTLFSQQGLLTSADVPGLANFQTPVFSSLTCSTGRFEIPGLFSLGEDLVRSPSGAVAVWAPSGLSLHHVAEVLNYGLFDAVFTAGTPRLGDAVLAALAAGASSETTPDFMLKIYNLIGDPALEIRLPESKRGRVRRSPRSNPRR